MKKNELKSLLFYQQNNLRDFLELSKYLRDRIIPLSETGVSSRVYNSWKQEQLLMEVQEENKWVRLNLLEFVWVMAIKNMREVGFSLSVIKEVKKILSEKIPSEMYRGNEEQKRTFQEALNQIPGDKGDKDMAMEAFDHPELETMLGEAGLHLNYFFALVTGVIFYRQTNGFMIFGTGEIIPWTSEVLNINFQGGELYTKSHYYFSINEELLKFLKDKSKEKYLKPLSLISEEETEVIKAIRNKDFKRIEIRPLKEKGHKKKLAVIIVNDGNLSDEQENKISDVLKLKSYESITLKKNNGTQIYFERQFRKNL